MIAVNSTLLLLFLAESMNCYALHPPNHNLANQNPALMSQP
ncbi:hypothetical protein ENHAE0001_1293 [Enhydrobacter aerosaccus SK60]|nr:hypothetical protein ENHAE0001_1293 [Enhydrobacter aerosaccus SK60]BAV10906.1 hypothetical protein MOSL_0333 [Moraxella osloensis]